jgi:hypothetical protein
MHQIYLVQKVKIQDSDDLLSSSDHEEDDLENTSILKKTKKLMVFKEINGRHHSTGSAKSITQYC